MHRVHTWRILSERSRPTESTLGEKSPAAVSTVAAGILEMDAAGRYTLFTADAKGRASLLIPDEKGVFQRKLIDLTLPTELVSSQW